MAIPTNSGEIVSVIASVSLLAPLVRALHRWHIDVRKTSKRAEAISAKTSHAADAVQGSPWSRMTRFEKWHIVSNFALYVMCSLLLLLEGILVPAHPATSHDVAVIGALVAMMVITSRTPNN